jgi:hypothetical protein
MIFIDKILQWGRNNGFSALYGTPEQVNEMMQETDFGASRDGTVMYCHLITDSETESGRDSATVAVYFCRLCDFDFDGEGLLPVQEELKDTGKALLHDIERGNVMAYDGVRWQYGYDDYAENVAWVCLRVTLTALSADCYGRIVENINPLCPVICIWDGYYYDEKIAGETAIVGIPPNTIYFNYAIPSGGVGLSKSDFQYLATSINYSMALDCADALEVETNQQAIDWLTQHVTEKVYLYKVVLSEKTNSISIRDPNSGKINNYSIYW